MSHRQALRIQSCRSGYDDNPERPSLQKIPRASLLAAAITRSSLTASLMLLALGVAVAGPFEDALAAYERSDYATALRLFRPLANQGIAKAQYNLGVMYA